MQPWWEFSGHILCMSRNAQCTRLKKEKLRIYMNIYEYSLLKYRVERWGKEKSPIKEELRLPLAVKNTLSWKRVNELSVLNVLLPSLICWCLYLWHVDTVNYIYYLWKSKRYKTLILHPSDPEVTEYWEMGKILPEESIKSRFLVLPWKEG